MSRICYAPESLNKNFLEAFEKMNMHPRLVAALVGIYDTAMEEQGLPKLDTSNVPMAILSLKNFRMKMHESQHVAINAAIKDMAGAYQTLKKSFTAEERVNRVNMLATEFSKELNALRKKYPEATRKELCNGYKSRDGQTVGGEYVLFVKIYESILDKYAAAVAQKRTDKALKYQKIIDNWHALIPFVRVAIRQTESINLGNSIEFAMDANEDNFEEVVLANLYDPEESTREGWQENDEFRSAFASIGKEVRRTLADTPVYLGDAQRDADLIEMESFISKARAAGKSEQQIEAYRKDKTATAGYQRDDLGYLVKMNPVVVHQQLMELLRGTIDQKHMMQVLNRAASDSEWLKPILRKLEADETLKTQFRNDLHKNFQWYSVMTEKIQDGIKVFKTKVKNKVSSSLKDEFKTRVFLGKQIQRVSTDMESVYDAEGNVNWQNLGKVLAAIRDMTYTGGEDKISSGENVLTGQNSYGANKSWKFNSLSTNKREKVNFLRSTLRALGINIGNVTLEQVLNDASARNTVVNALRDMVLFGYEGVLDSEIMENLKKGNYPAISKQLKYSELIANKGKQGGKQGKIEEKLDKIIDVLTAKSLAYKIESRVPYKDRKGKTNSLSSFINPCYLGDFVEKINAYANTRDLVGLRKFIEDKFMNSSFYGYKDQSTGKYVFYNKWLEELYNAKPDTIEKSFASLFKYKRFLGTSNENFEDFTSKQHALNMLTEFSFAENEKLPGGRKMAWYPVFITGDSGIQRYLEAPTYSTTEILDGLYKVFLQEEERWKLTRGANKKLSEGGFKSIKSFSDKDGRYTMLTFLNEDFVSPDGQKGKYFEIMKDKESTDKEAGVKEAIESYMEDAREKFKQQLATLGILERELIKDKKTGNAVLGRYIYLQQRIDDVKHYNSSIKSDEAALDVFLDQFYYNTKFATIQQLQLMTVDPAFYKDTKDLQKRYKEIHAPGTTIDIWARDKYNGGQFFCGSRTRVVNGQEVVEPDATERCLYFDEVKINALMSNPDFMKVIKKKFKGDSRYVKYMENNFTDGQGYRSLDSYRKVMGMAGKWDEEMERGYKRIKDLRAKIKAENRNATKEELEKLADILTTLTFQPLKPYLFSHEQLQLNTSEGGMLNIPVQHKYAEAVLIPELLPAGSRLRDLAFYMEDNNIDLVCSTEVVKVGCFGSVDISQAKNREELYAALGKAYPHQLYYGDYRLQTNVPDHFNNQSQLFGTQIRKLIMAGLDLQGDYSNYVDFVNQDNVHSNLVNLGGQMGMTKLNGTTLVRFYNELITSNIQDCYKLFADAVGDIKQLSNLLTQSIINNEREAIDNIIAFSLTNDTKFLVPLFEGATEHDSAALILSKFKKKVNKQTIQGGSAVQVSAFGIEGYDEDNSLQFVCEYEKDSNGEYVLDGQGQRIPINVLYAECEVPFDLTVYDENNQSIQLQFTDYCNPDGTLLKYEISQEKREDLIGRIKSADELLESIKEQFNEEEDKILTPQDFYDLAVIYAGEERVDEFLNSVSSKKELTYGKIKALGIEATTEARKQLALQLDELDRKSKLSKLEVEYPGILDMIAYRIPTERAYSMLNLKIKRFCQKTAGGTLKVPAQGTTIAGFDFDIDKLYFMRKCFKRQRLELSQEDTQKVWNYAYDQEPEVFETLKEAREKWKKQRKQLSNEDLEKISKEQQLYDDLINNLFESLAKFSGAEEFTKVETTVERAEAKNRLYKFWKEAGLSGTPQEFFDKYKDEALGLRGNEKFITYDPTKTPWENEKIARDNMLIDLMRARLMDVETFEARYTPQSFANSSRAARFMRELQFGELSEITDSNGNVALDKIEPKLDDKSSDPEPNYDPSDPMTIVTYNQQNQVAGKLIGIFANQNANHALSTLMHRFKLNKKAGCNLGFCGHTYDDFLHCSNPDINVDNNVAEFLAASVDAVKDPVLNFLNLNTLTANAGAVMARLGYTPQEIGLLLNQPIVKEVCETCFNNNSNQISEAINTALRNYADALHDKYGETYKYDEKTDGHLTTQILADNIVKGRISIEKGEKPIDSNNRDYIYDQIKALEQFRFALTLADAVSNFIRVTRFTAANSVGSTLGSIYAQQLAVDSYVRTLETTPADQKVLDMLVAPRILIPIHNTEDSFLSGEEYLASLWDNPFAYEQCMFDMNKRVLRDLRKYYPYETQPYSTARNLLNRLCNFGTLDEETINDLHSDLLVYMMTNTLGGSIFDGNATFTKDGVQYSNKQYYNEVFPREMVDTIERLKSGDPLFGALSYKSITLMDGKETMILSMENASSLQSFQSDAIRESWEELYEGRKDEFFYGSKEEQRQMAVNLFLYNFYKSGFSYTPFSFIHLAPAQLKSTLVIGTKKALDENRVEIDVPVTYVDFLNDVMDEKVLATSNMEDFAKKFIRNHIDNHKLVYTVRRENDLYASLIKALVNSGTPLYVNGVSNDRITVDLNKLSDTEKGFLTIRDPYLKKKSVGAVAFKPCLIIDNFVYMAVGKGEGQFNYSSTNSMEYEKIGEISDFKPDDTSVRVLDYVPESGKKASAPSKPTAPTGPVSGSKEGSTSVEPVVTDPANPNSTLYADIVNEMIEEMIKARLAQGFLMEEQVAQFRKDFQEIFSSASEKDIKDEIEAFRKAKRYENTNLLVLDNDGNMKPAC